MFVSWGRSGGSEDVATLYLYYCTTAMLPAIAETATACVVQIGRFSSPSNSEDSQDCCDISYGGLAHLWWHRRLWQSSFRSSSRHQGPAAMIG